MAFHNPKERSKEFLAEIRHKWRLNDLGQLVINSKYKSSGEVGSVFKGTLNGVGYKRVGVLGNTVQEHHIVWYLHTGGWPKQSLDHIDGDKTNNHPDNLRLSNNKHNSRSYKKVWEGASSKFRGVYWHKNNVWASCVSSEGKTKHLGCFTCQKEAALAYNYAAIKYGFSPEAFNQVFADDEVEVT